MITKISRSMSKKTTADPPYFPFLNRNCQRNIPYLLQISMIRLPEPRIVMNEVMERGMEEP